MNRVQQKSIARQKLSFKNRHDRFISEYIKARHSSVYREAEGFFNQVLVENPERRDLTKTHEFLVATTAFKNHEQYYYRKKTQSKLNYNMELKIPLLGQDTTTSVNVTEQPLVIPDLSNSEQPLVIPDRSNSEQPLVISNLSNSEQPLVIPDRSNSEQPLVIPDNIYQDLIKELSSDPELYSIFNDINIPETTKPENINTLQELCDTMELNEQTALERELAGLGF